MENNKCRYCEKTLKVIGHLRKNGKKHADWDSRDLHKKCWITLRKIKFSELYDKHFMEKELNNLSLVSIL